MDGGAWQVAVYWGVRWGGIFLWTGPPPQLLASEIKPAFLFTSLVFLLALEQQAAGPHLGNSDLRQFGFSFKLWLGYVAHSRS